MFSWLFRVCAPALAGAGCLLLVPTLHASGLDPKSIPTKIDAACTFRFDIQMGPQALVPHAPWYTYFPMDPNLIAQPGATPYPPWQVQQQAPQQAPQQRAPSTTPVPNWMPPAPMSPTRAPGPMTYYAPAYGAPLQPVGYMPSQAPSYWYGR